MSRERQKKQSEEVRGRILRAAREIIQRDGAEALSIRGITDSMNYSSGIVYHYFKDKDEILFTVLTESYEEVCRSVKNLPEGMNPEERLRAVFKTYIKSALENSLEYRAFMLSSLPAVLSANSVLCVDAIEKRPLLLALAQLIEEGVKREVFAPCDTRLSVCAVWSAMFGLLIRMIIEGTAPGRSAELIENQIEFILKGLKI